MSTKSRNAIDVLDLVISVLTEQQRELGEPPPTEVGGFQRLG